MNKRVHEIAKERGLPPKDVLARLKAAGVDVKAASSSVDEQVAARVLANGGNGQAAASAPGDGAKAAPARQPAAEAPAADSEAARATGADGSSKRPTRDSLQGERAPGNAGGRR